MGNGNQSCSIRQKFVERIDVEFAGVVDRCGDQYCTCLLANELPRYDIRVMFHVGDQDFVAGLQSRSAITLSNEVDRFRRAARQNDFFAV